MSQVNCILFVFLLKQLNFGNPLAVSVVVGATYLVAPVGLGPRVRSFAYLVHPLSFVALIPQSAKKVVTLQHITHTFS
jgi:hypothetical protein